MIDILIVGRIVRPTARRPVHRRKGIVTSRILNFFRHGFMKDRGIYIAKSKVAALGLSFFAIQPAHAADGDFAAEYPESESMNLT
jgi:hypothetical protein